MEIRTVGAAVSSVLPKEQAICELCLTSAETIPEASGWDFEYATSREEFRIVRCARCGLVYLANRPSAEAMSIIYPENYYSFDESSHQNSLVRALREKLEAWKVARYVNLLGSDERAILDVGCGDGRLLDILKARCPSSWTFMGIEIGEAGAVKVRAKGYPVLQGDFEVLEISDWTGRFDLVLMHQVLEHTRSPRGVIRKVRRLLKPGGIFSIETPDTQSWDRCLFRKRYWGGYHIPRHFYLFNKSTLTRLLEQEGYEIVSCKSILSPVFWIHSVHNFLIEQRPFFRLARYAHYQNPALLALATVIDLIQVGVFSQSSNMQILARLRSSP